MMSHTKKKQSFRKHLWMIYGLSLIFVGIILFYDRLFGTIGAMLFLLSLYYSLKSERVIQTETEKYISTLSSRIEKVSEVALRQIPVGILLFDENYKIEWVNPYIQNLFEGEDTLVGKSLHVLSDELLPKIEDDTKEFWLQFQSYTFQVFIRKDERILYLFDRTKQEEFEKLYHDEQTILAIIYLDNYEEITQNMDDTSKSKLNSDVTSVLNKWSKDYGIYLKRISQDRFIAVGTNKILKDLEETKFDILDAVRNIDLKQEQKNYITLSIGIGEGSTSLQSLGEAAQSSLDLALGRGGDQVVIKDPSGKVRFFGGKTNPMEKRTRVRARVISHALMELIKESDHVIIMGHKKPDMDSLGAAIGILAMARANGVQGSIVFNPDDRNIGIQKMIEEIQKDGKIWQHFLDATSVEEFITNRSLIVIVDTHRPSIVSNQELLEFTEYRVVIDHHRRGEEFIEKPTLVYMEPYASSTSELVTELIEYHPTDVSITMLESTALLAGIFIDTKGFTFKTGSRTFDAASYLRSKGADTLLVQKLLKEDLDTYLRRNELIGKTKIYDNQYAIAKADLGEVYDHIAIAKAADILLTMEGIQASFVISEREDGKIGISARSLGEINVQVVMEKLGGGGHLMNAATQLEDLTIDEAEEKLKEILKEY